MTLSSFSVFYKLTSIYLGFPGSASGKEPTNAEDTGDAGSIPGLGRSPEGGHSNPPHFSRLENPMDRGAWWATVHRVAKSQTQLNQLSMNTREYIFTFFSRSEVFIDVHLMVAIYDLIYGSHI